MTKSKNFWAATAFACLILTGASGWSLYNRLAVHFLSDIVEIRPRPVPLLPPDESAKDEAAGGPEAAVKKTPDRPAAKADAKAAPAPAREDKAAQAKAAAGRPEEPAKPKAVKTIFEYKSASAKSVRLAGTFTKWNEVKMTRKAPGIWKAEEYIFPGIYPYHFVVDGKKVLDPGKPKAERTGESLVDVK